MSSDVSSVFIAASPIHYGTIFINEEDIIDFYFE